MWDTYNNNNNNNNNNSNNNNNDDNDFTNIQNLRTFFITFSKYIPKLNFSAYLVLPTIWSFPVEKKLWLLYWTFQKLEELGEYMQ